MNRYFHLYPESEEQQRMRLSLSLMDIHKEPEFGEVIAPYEVQVIEPEDKIIPGSWQELVVRPPLPPQLIKKFGDELVKFATSKGRAGHEMVVFLDHTQGYEDPFLRRREQPTGIKQNRHLKIVGPSNSDQAG